MDKPMTFIEWCSSGGKIPYSVGIEEAYEAGQQSQQAKVEELQKQLSEYIFVAETLDEMYVKEVQKSDELQKRVDALTLALDQIAYPIPHMQKEAELNGCELNGYWAVKMSEDHTYSKDIARRALEKEQALKDGEA
ncbi:hypothetical protein AXE41_RS19885 [Acinetobacter baumannii]|uniref:Ead/Ea22-like family protein n=1 Tax=Acinetobacter baumannii TaxID=470 RepID=A0AAX1ZTP5_ACIBA|nr:hypothetical protein [Acinetobacter baumannii]EHU1923793.1 hypothetical protein [Acinetobacter baumannii]EHU1988550.1 hypothetical protein [Acinetobacter baumannii]EHU1990441.1 hypothetical protein [Acinetobacter baumannii]EHU2639127.1 hypothetical protein [Acinetobacter baumannii]EHU3101447.1 hypothetical protein [Acinetobacter baumannii]